MESVRVPMKVLSLENLRVELLVQLSVELSVQWMEPLRELRLVLTSEAGWV